MSTPEMNSFARRLRAIEKGQRRAKTPSLAQSSIEGGALTAVDDDANQTMVIGRQFDDTNAAAVVTGPTPPIPSTPGVFSSPGAIRVYWDGTFANALVAPMDFSRVTVHVLPVAEYDDATFDPTNQSYIYGSIEQATGGEISPILEPGEYAVVLVTWTIAGKFSEESQVGLGTSRSVSAGDIAPDGFAPATAPTIAWAGGIGSVFYRWGTVPNADPTEYALYVRAGSPPTTVDSTYLVASGNIQQASIRSALGPDPDNETGPEIVSAVTPGVDYYGVVVAYDADGQGPDSLPAIAQSVLINSPDIATDAITTRHLQADSVGVDQILAGSIDANKLAARLVIASEILLGNLDNSGLDPVSLNPNLLPALTPANINDAAGPAVGTWGRGFAAGWTVSSEVFSPVNDDPYWERMAPGSLQAVRLETGSPTGTTPATWRTQVVVEPNTEYRFEFNTAMPGMDPLMPATGIAPDCNSVRWVASSDNSFQNAEIVSWKSFRREDTPRPDLTKFDRGVIKTGSTQTVLWLELQIRGEYLVGNSGGYIMPTPELRKVESTTIPAPLNAPVVSALSSAPDPAATLWRAGAVWTGTTSGITSTSSIVTPTSSGGAFDPSYFSTPGRYAIPEESHTFQQAKGLRITTQSGGSGLGLTARILAPAQAVPALSPMESLLLGIGFSGLTQATDGLDDFSLTASWFDASDTLISNQVLIDLDAAGLVAQGITNLTENYFQLQLSPPVGAAKVVIWSEFSNGPSGNIAAGVDQTPTMFGLRLYTLGAINYNYGNMAKRHVEIDSTGIKLVNTQGQVQVYIPTDENETPTFKGGIEAEWARFLAGASFEGQSEVAKDATISLSDGIKSPIGTPTLVQEYEQYTMQRQPPNGQYPGFSSKPTLNPAEITGMVYKSTWNEFWIMENRGGGSAIWRFGADGSCLWASLQAGWSNAMPIDDPRTTNNLYAGEYGGNHWAYVYNGSTTVTNKLPAGTVPEGVEPVYTWNSTNNRFYVWYPHIDGSGRNVYKRLSPSASSGGTMSLEETVVGGSGTSRSSWASGLAGTAIIGSSLYTAARGTTGADVYAFAAGSGGALDSGARWPLASPPKGFCYDGNSFWQVDTAGKFTKYSDWTWPETNHKIYAGITWFDSDTAGTGVHETDLTKVASATLRKRISGIRVTLPSVPDKGGADDPDRWRLYALKGASAALPGSRTSFFLQSQGGSPSQQTTYIIPANGLVVSGTNPPASNNFPSAGPGRIFSSAVDGSSNPLIDLKGNGESDLGNFKVRSGVANIGRMQTWLRSGGRAVVGSTYVTDDGGYSTIYGDHTTNDGWTGCVYTGAGLFTCNETGWYEIEIGRNWASGAGTRRWTLLWLNEPATPSDTNAYRMKAEGYSSGNFFGVLRLDVYLTAGNTFRAGWRHDDGSVSISGTNTQGPTFGGTQYGQYVQIKRTS